MKVKESIKASSNTWLTSVDVEKQEGKRVAIGTLDNKILIFEINKGKDKNFFVLLTIINLNKNLF